MTGASAEPSGNIRKLLRSLAFAGRPAFQKFLQEMTGVGALDLDDVFRCAGCHHFAAARAAFRADVDDPVGRLDDFEVVFDHHDGIALVHQRLQHFQQLVDVMEVKAGRWFVENVKRAARRAFRQFLGELDALRLAAG